MDTSGAEILGKKHIRRTWSDDEKRMICDQARLPGVSTAQVARRYAMNANLLFKWLRDPAYQADITGEDQSVFLPVEISDGPPLELAAPAAAKVTPPHLEPEDQCDSVESLKPGDHVVTLDRGAQPIRWTRRDSHSLDEASTDDKPIQIKAGTLGANIRPEDVDMKTGIPMIYGNEAAPIPREGRTLQS